jgi:hypothetical protein
MTEKLKGLSPRFIRAGASRQDGLEATSVNLCICLAKMGTLDKEERAEFVSMGINTLLIESMSTNKDESMRDTCADYLQMVSLQQMK